jgi:hypothetical protein
MSTGSIEITEKDRQKILDALDADTAEKPKAAEHKDSSREYVVLRKQPMSSPSAPQLWEEITKVEATSNDQALRKVAVNIEDNNPVSFVAIPSRSFQPTIVEKKTTTTLILT